MYRLHKQTLLGVFFRIVLRVSLIVGHHLFTLLPLKKYSLFTFAYNTVIDMGVWRSEYIIALFTNIHSYIFALQVINQDELVAKCKCTF